MKRLQNKIAESRMTLSFVSVLGFLICIACGAIGMQLGNTVFSNVAWWEQVLILAVSTMLMVELNNANSLIRIYITATDASWNCQLVDGHWSPNTPFPGCDFNNGNWDLAEHGGALELQVTDYVYEHITSTQGWGGSFLLNGDNVICTKVTVE